MRKNLLRDHFKQWNPEEVATFIGIWNNSISISGVISKLNAHEWERPFVKRNHSAAMLWRTEHAVSAKEWINENLKRFGINIQMSRLPEKHRETSHYWKGVENKLLSKGE